ncbi:MAG: hypothetical protein IKG53_06235, partial [Solobacterium sp.]|nr:hypothetical protein [Solobacterium sp.]
AAAAFNNFFIISIHLRIASGVHSACAPYHSISLVFHQFTAVLLYDVHIQGGNYGRNQNHGN